MRVRQLIKLIPLVYPLLGVSVFGLVVYLGTTYFATVIMPETQQYDIPYYAEGVNARLTILNRAAYGTIGDVFVNGDRVIENLELVQGQRLLYLPLILGSERMFGSFQIQVLVPGQYPASCNIHVVKSWRHFFRLDKEWVFKGERVGFEIEILNSGRDGSFEAEIDIESIDGHNSSKFIRAIMIPALDVSTGHSSVIRDQIDTTDFPGVPGYYRIAVLVFRTDKEYAKYKDRILGIEEGWERSDLVRYALLLVN